MVGGHALVAENSVLVCVNVFWLVLHAVVVAFVDPLREASAFLLAHRVEGE